LYLKQKWVVDMGVEELRFVQEAFEGNYISPLGTMVDAFSTSVRLRVQGSGVTSRTKQKEISGTSAGGEVEMATKN
jgi:hypothetical protein